ncbi:unnamed protein product, partial [Sphagnum balticum]
MCMLITTRAVGLVIMCSGAQFVSCAVDPVGTPLVCHDLCTNGCWGTRRDQCYDCKYYRLMNDTFVGAGDAGACTDVCHTNNGVHQVIIVIRPMRTLSMARVNRVHVSARSHCPMVQVVTVVRMRARDPDDYSTRPVVDWCAKVRRRMCIVFARWQKCGHSRSLRVSYKHHGSVRRTSYGALCYDVSVGGTLVHRIAYRRKLVVPIVVTLSALLFLSAICVGVFRNKWLAVKRAHEMPIDPEREEHEVNGHMTCMYIIPNTELRFVDKLGEGAFGIVYLGEWSHGASARSLTAEEPTVYRVAVKKVVEYNKQSVNEIIDEVSRRCANYLPHTPVQATVMGSMLHPHLVRLIGISLADDGLAIVSQYCADGCLLDFLKKNHGKLSNTVVLQWAQQIAEASGRGMEYLEQNRYVHRDLAARNVLVRSVEHVCVSDFGLTKMMQRDEKEIIIGGKVAIKWLALECIRHKRFTCKSDVWAYGVTLWEILSYPSRPYDGVPINELPALLTSGERLPQPQCASLELYMLLIKCWMVDEQSRPSFGEI